MSTDYADRAGGIRAASETVLEEAQRIIHGDRPAAYGHPLDDFARTGRLWGAVLGIHDVPAETVALMLAMVKVSRQVNLPKRDNLVDLVGYTGCIERIERERARRKE